MHCSPCQPPLSMGFSRQGYWSGLPRPSPGDCLGLNPVSCVGKWVLYHWASRAAPITLILDFKMPSEFLAGNNGSDSPYMSWIRVLFQKNFILKPQIWESVLYFKTTDLRIWLPFSHLNSTRCPERMKLHRRDLRDAVRAYEGSMWVLMAPSDFLFPQSYPQ